MPFKRRPFYTTQHFVSSEVKKELSEQMWAKKFGGQPD
jgi:hypothetical protein